MKFEAKWYLPLNELSFKCPDGGEFGGLVGDWRAIGGRLVGDWGGGWLVGDWGIVGGRLVAS